MSEPNERSELSTEDDITLVSPEIAAAQAIGADGAMSEGAHFAGRYKVLELLGSGGMSRVFKCEDSLLQRIVAVKVLLPASVADERLIRRLHREAVAVSKLSHPNIIGVHEFVADATTPYMVMDYIEGQTLDDQLKEKGSLALDETIKLTEQVASALEHAHSLGVVHRDLKPSNIIISATDGTAKIVDFGIAKIEGSPLNEFKLTQTGEIVGTPLYMSPEQCQGKSVEPASDQYSLACVIYHCLSGTPPFFGTTLIDTLLKKMQDKPPTLKEASLGKTFPDHVEEALSRALEKEPEKRFPTMSAFRESLYDRPQSTAQLAAPTIAPQASSPAKRYSIIAFVIIALALVAMTLRHNSPPKPPLASSAADKADAVVAVDQPGPSDLKIMEEFPRFRKSGRYEFKSRDVGIVTVRSLTKEPYVKSAIFEGNLEIDNAAVKVLSTIGSLEELDLTDTDVNQDCITDLLRLPNLRYLSLRGVHDLDDKALARLADNKDLKLLDLGNTAVSNAGCPTLASLPHLENLTLDNDQIGDAGVALLVTLPLTNLSLRGTKVSPAVVQTILKMPRLTHLSLSDTNISDSALSALASKKSLRDLNLKGCSNLSKQAIDDFARKIPTCAVGW